MPTVETPVDALLLIDSLGSQCAEMLESVVALVSNGRIGKLEIINVKQRPEWREQLAVRQVPWLSLGAFELHGVISRPQLEEWINHVAQGSGWTEYLLHLMHSQRLDAAVALVRDQPSVLVGVLEHLAETTPDSGINIHALLEELADSATLRTMLPQLEQLASHPAAAIRADAAHFLGLTGDHRAWAPLRTLTQDPAPAVRHRAHQALSMLDPHD